MCKSSFYEVLFGFTQIEHFATISKVKRLDITMVTSGIIAVFIDEMTKEILPADQDKILIQGGVLTVERKHNDLKIA